MSKHFKKEEFACQCGCGFDYVDPRLESGLELLRDILRKPIIINSGCRCKKHNAEVGGEPNSQHLLGKAADIRIVGILPQRIFQAAALVPEFQQGGIGIYDTWLHVDVRTDGRPHRWDKRKRKHA